MSKLSIELPNWNDLVNHRHEPLTREEKAHYVVLLRP